VASQSRLPLHAISARCRRLAPTLTPVSEADLDALIDEATVDCYNEDEELTGFAVMLEDNLTLPFETTVLGVTATVNEIRQTASGIVAICVRGSTGRPFPSSTFSCQTRLRKAPNGSRPTATGQDRKRQA
jgi:Calcium binding